MTKIKAFLIHEVRGFDASFKLLREALCRGGIEVIGHIGGRENPKTLPWCRDDSAKTTDLSFDVLLLGSLHCVPELSDNELKAWVRCIQIALDKGAGLVAMLDDRTAKALAILDPNGALLPIHFKKLAPTLNPDVRGVIFRPRLTVEGRTNQATKDMVNKNLPPFGSLTRSYYRTVKQENATVLMEIPEYVDDCAYPFLTVRKVRDQANGPGIAIMAADWCNTGGQEFVRWPDASVLLSGLGRWAAGKEDDDPSPYPIAAQPAHWFLKSDRKHTIENWKDIIDSQGQLKKPYPVEPPSVNGAVQATLGSGQITNLSCNNAPLISETEQGSILKAKLCNGIVVHLSKVAMEAGYCLDQPAGDSVMVAKVPPESKPTYMPSPWKWAEYVESPRIKGASLVVTYKLYSDETKQKHTGTLHWEFTPSIKEIEGTKWACVGETFTLSDLPSDIAITSFRAPLHRWQLGHTIDCHASYRLACYTANPNLQGFRRVQFSNSSEEQGDPFHWFYSGQPFQMLTYEGGDENRILWCYTTTAAAVRSEMCKAPLRDYIELDLSVELGRQTGSVQLPTFWYCFAEQGFSHNLWLAAYDYLRQLFRENYGIERTYPRPTAMLRYHFTYLNELRHYADTFIPLAKELGFKRIDCGVRYVNDLFFPLHDGINALHYLCTKAHEAGIEVIFYCGASWCHDGHHSLGPNHICNDWRIKTAELKPKLWENTREGRLQGTEYQEVDGLDRRIVLVSLRSDWYKASLARYEDLKSRTGIDGVWLDSWRIPNDYHDINYAEPAPAPAVAEAMQYVADLQKRGYLVLVEGQSPVALESFWYHHSPGEPLHGNEFALSGMAPFASNDDGLLTDDLFRLLAYNCALFQDIRLLADETDAVTQLTKACNKMMNSIHEKLGMPLRVRELSVTKAKDKEPIGTFWECEKGIAIFGLRTANQLRIDLPSIIASHVLVEQHDIRSPEGTTNMQIRSKEASEDGQVYLEGQLAAGGVVIIQTALGNESTDAYLPIIQH